MDIKREHLSRAADAGLISPEQARSLWRFLADATAGAPAFRPAQILYYLGGIIAIAALSFFVTLAWESWAGWPMLALAVSFAILGLALTHYFMHRKRLPIPAGIMITFTVALTPLAVYSVQHALGLWQGDYRSTDFHRYVDWRWILMELATLASAAVALWRYRMPFLLLPVSVVLWYLQMDLVPFVFQDEDVDWALRKQVSVWFGLLMMLLAFWIDVRSGRRRDYAFWLYLFGVLTFWGGLTSMDSDSELSKLGYFCINVILLLVGTLIARRVFAVFAGLGMLAYLGHLSYEVFRDSLLFPVALAGLGIAIVLLGVQWQRHERRLHALILSWLPAPVRSLVERVHE